MRLYSLVPATPSFDFLKRFHLEGLEQAREAHGLPFNERKFRSLLMTLNQEQMQVAEKLINEFAETLFTQIEMIKTPEAAKVYRLNLQFFPLSQDIS